MVLAVVTLTASKERVLFSSSILWPDVVQNSGVGRSENVSPNHQNRSRKTLRARKGFISVKVIILKLYSKEQLICIAS